VFRITAGFFRLLFKDIVYALLVKIYYGVFRLKKNDLVGKAVDELTRNQLVYLFLTALTAGFIIANLTNQNPAGALETNISKTVLANLITSGFDVAPAEVLIEDNTQAGRSLAAGQNQYSANSYTLEKPTNLAAEDNTAETSLPLFNDNDDLIFKPPLTNEDGNTVASPASPNTPVPSRTSITYYTVQDGDTVSSIARRFNISANTILWANGLTAYSLIQPGDSLTILPYSGVLYTVQSGDTVTELASKYGVDADQILSYNDLNAGLKIGQKIVIPGGRPIASTAVAAAKPSPSYTGLSAIQDLIKTPTKTSYAPAKASGSGLIWPTQGHNITQYFSWHHPAVDIANHIGTPIYAAADGVVLIAQGGWNGGYGNTILLDNGNNMKTRYGHASKLLVSPGDTVKKGQVIALMGSTGNSTGPHLHFEVLVDGVHYNPLNYVR
jgi:murein DD-endopeptidase MepM/ murein hydrolase activator NlpD